MSVGSEVKEDQSTKENYSNSMSNVEWLSLGQDRQHDDFVERVLTGAPIRLFRSDTSVADLAPRVAPVMAPPLYDLTPLTNTRGIKPSNLET